MGTSNHRVPAANPHGAAFRISQNDLRAAGHWARYRTHPATELAESGSRTGPTVKLPRRVPCRIPAGLSSVGTHPRCRVHYRTDWQSFPPAAGCARRPVPGLPPASTDPSTAYRLGKSIRPRLTQPATISDAALQFGMASTKNLMACCRQLVVQSGVLPQSMQW